MLVDSHCHLSSDEIYPDLENVIKRAEEKGVGCFLNAAGKFDDLKKQIQICTKFDNVYTVTGVHPHDASDYENVTCLDVVKNTIHKKVVAIGECGLDYFYDFSPRDVQIKVFRKMIEASQETGLPLIVHTREADTDTVELIKTAYKKKSFKGVIHCYSSSYELAKEMLEIGFYISASGIITFQSAENLRENFKKIPLSKLLIETDSPYLAPVPYRGKTNEPSYVIETAVKLAELKGVNFEDISKITTENFFNLFDKVKR